MTEIDDFDGCGVRPFATDTKDPFYPACKWHDATYTFGSWHQSQLSRKIIDLQFYRQMLVIAGDNVGLRIRAWFYYRLARIFGARLWEGKRL